MQNFYKVLLIIPEQGTMDYVFVYAVMASH